MNGLKSLTSQKDMWKKMSWHLSEHEENRTVITPSLLNSCNYFLLRLPKFQWLCC